MKKIISLLTLSSFFAAPIVNCAEKSQINLIDEFKISSIRNIIPRTLYDNRLRHCYVKEEKLQNGEINYYIPNTCNTPYSRDSILKTRPINKECKMISFGIYFDSIKDRIYVPFEKNEFTESDLKFQKDNVDIDNVKDRINNVNIILKDPNGTGMTFEVKVNIKELRNLFSSFLRKFNEKKDILIDSRQRFHFQSMIINNDENALYLIYEIDGLQHYYKWNLLDKKIIKLFINSMCDESRKYDYLSILYKDEVTNNEQSINDDEIDEEDDSKIKNNHLDSSISTKSGSKNKV